MSGTRRASVDQHAKSHGIPWGFRSHHEMKIAGVKTIYEAPIGLVQKPPAGRFCRVSQ
jgi:hypothetical protein